MIKNESNLNNKELIKALCNIDPKKPMGMELFNSVARVSISVAIDVVALREGAKGIKVFLTKRSEVQSFPGMWHLPGTVLRPGETEKQAFARLEKNEFKNSVNIKKFLYFLNYPKGDIRGHFLILSYLGEMKKKSSKNWFPISNLPESIVDYQKNFSIPKAVEAYLKTKT